MNGNTGLQQDANHWFYSQEQKGQIKPEKNLMQSVLKKLIGQMKSVTDQKDGKRKLWRKKGLLIQNMPHYPSSKV